MPFFYRIVFSPFVLSFNFCLFMTVAGRYATALGNETLHGRTTDFIAFHRVLIMRFPIALIDHYRKYHNIL